MLADGTDSSYEDVVKLVTEGDLERGAVNETLIKSSPRKAIQRQSIVAQAWRKPSFGGASERLPRLDRQDLMLTLLFQWQCSLEKQILPGKIVSGVRCGYAETKCMCLQGLMLSTGCMDNCCIEGAETE